MTDNKSNVVSNVVPLPSPDAKARADEETENKRKLFAWADLLLQKIGIAQNVAQAKSADDLEQIKLDVEDVDVVIAVRDALHPSSGKCEKHFEYVKADTLKRILKMRFEELKHYRELELGRGGHEQYDASVCLPDVILAALNEYVDVKEHEAVAIVLWALHCHVYERFTISPRLALRSPRPGCGKTTLLDMLSLLTPRGKRIDHTTAAPLFRIIHRDHPTILIDEGDNLEMVGTIRSIMNSGHRKGGHINRWIDGEDVEFDTFGPMAVAVIGTLPEALLDRSIIINLRRTLRTDLRRFNIDDPYIENVVKPICRQMSAWARTKPTLNPNPELPKKLRNRISDNWLVLISIADCFGTGWGKMARAAAAVFLRTIKDEDLSTVMLASIRRAFDDVLKDDRCTTEQMVKELHSLHDAPWNEFCGIKGTGVPHKIKEAEVTKLLSKYEIYPKTVWPKNRKRSDTTGSYRGWMRAWFEDAWARYCTDDDDDE